MLPLIDELASDLCVSVFSPSFLLAPKALTSSPVHRYRYPVLSLPPPTTTTASHASLTSSSRLVVGTRACARPTTGVGAMADQGGGRGAVGETSVSSFLADIPPVTRYLLLGTLAVTCGSGLGVVSPSVFVLDWQAVFGRFQVWRPFFTLLHQQKLNFNFILKIMYLYQYSKQLEMGAFGGNTADYVAALMYISVGLMLTTAVMPFMVLGPALIAAIVHIWGRHNPTLPVSLYGFVSIPAGYLSFALVGLFFVINGGAIDWISIAGIIVGHAYFFMDSIYPTLPGRGGARPLKTPAWVVSAVERLNAGADAAPRGAPPGRSAGGGGATSAAGRSSFGSSGRDSAATGASRGFSTAGLRSSMAAAAASGGRSWGSGRRLGSD